MGKLLCDTTPLLPWPESHLSPAGIPPAPASTGGWESVTGLDEQQRLKLERMHARGVHCRNLRGESSPQSGTTFSLSHGGDVEADGNCLFTAARRAMGSKIGAGELRMRTVRRFLEDCGSDGGVDEVVRHLYSPDLKAGWGIHVVQEVKMIVRKADREMLDLGILELVDMGMVREVAAQSIYKERCIPVNDGQSWAKYMSISGSSLDDYDIITLQYTEEGLLTIDENRDGRAAAFGDDIAIESLATEFKREIFVVQSHGSDAMVDEENCIFFFPHRPRGETCESPLFLFMKGTGWCGAGADHYEPLLATPMPLISQEKAAVVL